MFGSTILDLATGLIFTFLVISLIASAVTEGVASALSWRAKTLLQGVKDLLNDQQFTGLALDIYNHDLVNPRSNGLATSAGKLTAKPSYIEPTQFAAALIDVVGLVPGGNVAALQQQIGAKIKDQQLKTMLTGFVDRTAGDIDRVRDDVASWFDNSMDRVAGAYKRKTQLYSFFIALAVAIALNVDTITIATALWRQPMLVKQLPTLSDGMKPTDGYDDLRKSGLPFGWGTAETDIGSSPNWRWPYALLGWLITAAATLFGAPFWFDTLQRFVQLRGTGSK